MSSTTSRGRPASRATCSAWTSRSGRTCCTSTTYTSAPRCSSGGTRRARLATLVHDKRVTGPKIVLGDFNEWARGLATDILAHASTASTSGKHLRRERTYPGFFPILHLDHIYYEGRVEVMKVTLPRDRLTLIASDHLPLVADLKIGF